MNIVQGEGYRLIQGDCLEVMAGMDGPVDAIIADLPYGTTQNDWDAVIPMDLLWTQFKRLIKPNGAIALFGSQPFTSALVMSNPKWFKYDWTWEKTTVTNVLNAKIEPLSNKEDILIFSKNTTTYNPQGTRPVSWTKIDRGASQNYGAKRHLPYVQSVTNYPRQVIRFCPDLDRLHPTAKPISLLRFLIRTYTNPGETVLDCTMGSGTTIVAAIQEGRQSIGIELDAGYFDIAVKRCADASRAARGLPKQLKDDRLHDDLPLFAGEQ